METLLVSKEDPVLMAN